MAKNNLGAFVDILGYTSTKYVADLDGYAWIQGTNAGCEIYSADFSTYTYSMCIYAGVGNQYSTTACAYVRKGMQLKIFGTVSAARFYRIITA